VIALEWRSNPIDPEDPRPLIVVVEDYQGHEAYTSDGWWRILTRLESKWGVDEWIADPHNPRLIKAAKKAGVTPLREGAQQDKTGRIALVASLIHWDDEKGIEPALYVSRLCATSPGSATTPPGRCSGTGGARPGTAGPRTSPATTTTTALTAWRC
jgi:hypothetical protein